MKDQFQCEICGTIYQHKDLRDACMGIFDGKREDTRLIDDAFSAEEGERVLRTQYHGDAYARSPYKAGLFLTYEWTYVREKRIIPVQYKSPIPAWNPDACHFACYRIGDAEHWDEKDRWDIPALGSGIGFAMGPYHFWSKRLVESNGNRWPDYVIDMCVGERSDALLREKAREGYQIAGLELDGSTSPGWEGIYEEA